jgi:hypothetical protein
VPLFLTDGFKEYTTALLAHFGHWVPLPRRQATGPAPHIPPNYVVEHFSHSSKAA